MIYIILLLVALEIKHFFCDWVFQTDYIVSGKGKEKDWFMPLFVHAFIHHALFTSMIMVAFSRSLYIGMVCGLFDGVSHMIIDRIKSDPNGFGRFKNPANKFYWVLMGADQAAHHFCYFIIIFGHKFIPAL